MQTKRAKHIVDILLGIGLLLLMSYQVVGEAGHEWTGIAMTALMIVHQILNRNKSFAAANEPSASASGSAGLIAPLSLLPHWQELIRQGAGRFQTVFLFLEYP